MCVFVFLKLIIAYVGHLRRVLVVYHHYGERMTDHNSGAEHRLTYLRVEMTL